MVDRYVTYRDIPESDGLRGVEFGRPAPDGLYVVRNGIAVAVTAEELADVLSETVDRERRFRAEINGKLGRHIIDKIVARALSRPADGAAE